MKQETDKEMELLLRRLGRSASDAAIDGDHLDADELSSYAENALPAAARARYTEHLAECANCRKLISQLSSSLGVVSVAEAGQVSEPSALKRFLASLFSPLVLRYAVPALGLIVVAVIGLTVFRSEGLDRPTSVAQLKEAEKNAQPEQVQSPAPGLLDSRGYNDSPVASPDTRAERSKETQPTPAPTSASETAATQGNEAPITKSEQPKAEPPPPASPAEPKSVAASDETQKREIEARKDEIANRSVSDLPKQEQQKAEDRKSDNDFTAAPAAGTGASIAKLRRGSVEEKETNDAETRSIAGRRFRRERGIWIDTAYHSSRSPFSVTRGSEQYRTLVADEPAIKTIADQLDGEIILVWKGRAYRIQ